MGRDATGIIETAIRAWAHWFGAGAQRRPLGKMVSCRPSPHQLISPTHRDRRTGRPGRQRPPLASECKVRPFRPIVCEIHQGSVQATRGGTALEEHCAGRPFQNRSRGLCGAPELPHRKRTRSIREIQILGTAQSRLYRMKQPGSCHSQKRSRSSLALEDSFRAWEGG